MKTHHIVKLVSSMILAFAAQGALGAANGVHEKVQLWEGGPYWATTNIGAERPEDYGYYFWWGDTMGYKRNEFLSWQASDGSSVRWSFKKDNTPTCGKWEPTLQSEGWITAKNVLASKHDAAHVHWGGNWRLPTKQELDDLKNMCDWMWTTNKYKSATGWVSGCIVRGRGEYAFNSIFLPCGSRCENAQLYNPLVRRDVCDGDDCYMEIPSGYYWSSVPYCKEAFAMSFAYYKKNIVINFPFEERYRGLLIRPVQGSVYTVTFNANGGIGGLTRSVKIGAAVGALPTPTRSGYSFNGWWTAASGGSKIKTSTKVTDNVIYYARWTANKYKIKFNKNGGKGKMKTLSATYDKTVTLRANTFKRTGYKFAGWAKKKKGTVAYKNKAKVKNLTAKNGKAVTLYAKWKRAKSGNVRAAATVDVAKSTAAVATAVPSLFVGTFYGDDESAFTTITISKTGKVSGKVVFANGKWAIVGKTNGQRIDAVVTDEEGSSWEVALAIIKKEDGSCRIESDDGSICASLCL